MAEVRVPYLLQTYDQKGKLVASNINKAELVADTAQDRTHYRCSLLAKTDKLENEVKLDMGLPRFQYVFSWLTDTNKLS